MKNRFKIAKEMLKVKLEEAKSEEVKSQEARLQGKPVSKKAKIQIQKPPRYMGIIGILAGLSFFFFLTGELRSIWECRNWPTVPGVIMSSKVVKTDRMETNTRPGGKGMTSRIVYLPAVSYKYEVDGRQYRSDRVFLWMKSEDYHDPKNARKIVGRYPQGKGVTVYYDPEDHLQAVLETKIRLTHFLFPGIAILFLLLGLWALLGKSKKE